MTYNQISPSGTIISGPNPSNFSSEEIKNLIFDALNSYDYSFEWTQQRSQPYRGILFDGTNNIDLYIYAWNISPAYRTNPSEKRIQIQSSVNNVGIDRPITTTEKTIILGLYNSPTRNPLFAAWDTTVNRGHGQKSCYVQIEDVAKAIAPGIYSTKDKHNVPIYTMTSSFLGDYVSLLKASNILAVVSTPSTTPFSSSVKASGLSNRKKRAIRKTNDILSSIHSLKATEKEAICTQRIGQGLFKELLMDKYSCKCALCNITTKSMLIGSHIKEWTNSTDDEKLDVNNGLLLCAHHDALFDKHLISFNDDGTLIISPLLDAPEQATLNLSSISVLTVTNEMKPYLAYHRAKLKR